MIETIEGKNDAMVSEFFNLNEEQQKTTPTDEQKAAEEAEAKRIQDEATEAERIAKEAKETPAKEEEKPVVIQKWEDSITDPKARWIADKLAKENGDEEVFNALKEKFEYKSFSPEQKVIAHLAAENPELDNNELLLLAAEQYGVGIEEVDLDDPDLSDDEKRAYRMLAIARKKAIASADSFFKERASNIMLPDLPNPLESDEGYKSYQEYLTQQEEFKKQQDDNQAIIDAVMVEMDTTAKSLNKLDIDLKLDLDGGEFAIKSDFKLDDKQQNELAEYAKRYQPSEQEVKEFTDTKSGKFDMNGYVNSIAKKCFAEQLIKAAVKQALSQDRERFVEKDLYNNGLRNNEISESTTTTQEFWEIAMGR